MNFTSLPRPAGSAGRKGRNRRSRRRDVSSAAVFAARMDVARRSGSRYDRPGVASSAGATDPRVLPARWRSRTPATDERRPGTCRSRADSTQVRRPEPACALTSRVLGDPRQPRTTSTSIASCGSRARARCLCFVVVRPRNPSWTCGCCWRGYSDSHDPPLGSGRAPRREIRLGQAGDL